MKEVMTPLARVRREKRMIDLFLPQISDTMPARNVPTAKPEKKIILARTDRLES